MLVWGELFGRYRSIIAKLMVYGAGIYLAAGVALAPVTVLWLVNRIDPAARNGTTGFRLMILPGAVLLWPLLMYRARRQSGPAQR